MNDRQYFATVAEIDYLMWELESMLKTECSLSALDRAIDKATGFEAVKLREAKRMMRRVRRLQERLLSA